MKIAVTGAGGFVGSHLVAACRRRGMAVRSLVRRARGPDDVGIGDIGGQVDWHGAVQGVDVVVHAAARVHQMEDRAADPLAAFRRVNTEATRALAQASAATGVRRLVFLSSVKVNGEATAPGRPFRADDDPAPVDPYGISKWEAEQRLAEVAGETGLEVVIVRPPLVYGPGVGANVERMMRWLARGLPLPLGAVDNRRSMIGIDNLCDLLIAAATVPAAAGRVLLASDGDDLSTTRLLRILRAALASRSVLVPVPAPALAALAAVAGRREIANRLLGNLQVDIEPTRSVLGWTQGWSVEAGLRQAADAFRGDRG